MQVLGNQKGAGMITVIIWIAVLIIVIHTGVKIGMVYFDYERMKDEMETKANASQVLKDEEIVGTLVAKVQELGLPIDPSDIVVQRDEGNRTMTISTHWEQEVHFLFDVYVKTYHFAPSVSAMYGAPAK